MTTIVERDPSQVDTFRSVVGASAEALDSLDQARRHLDEHPTEYAVVLGPSVSLEAASGFADAMRISQPALSVILVRKRVDTVVLTEALRAGIREVVEERDLAKLSDAVRRAYALWQAMSHNPGVASTSRGQLFTVFSSKGGVGKSTLTTNLAAAVADECHKNVCVVDLDVASGDVAIMLQLFPTNTLADLAGMSHSLDPASIESLITPHSDRLSVLAAPLQPHAREQVHADAVGRVLELLITMYDVVVVDTSGAFDDFALQAFDHSDLVLLIGTLDIPALKSLKLASETLDLLNISRERWRLVLNRADSKVGLSADEVEQTLKASISTAIPSSRDVPACINRGEPIVRAEPKHPVSQSIRQLAVQLVGGVSTQSTEAAVAASHRRSLLRRRAAAR